MPLMFGPKAKVRQAVEAAGIPHTYIVSYGFASYWANGLGELSQNRDRIPPAPTGNNKVPVFGTGRTKCEELTPLSFDKPACVAQPGDPSIHTLSLYCCLQAFLQ